MAGHSSAEMAGMGGGLGPHARSVSSSLSLLPVYSRHVKAALSPSFCWLTVYALITIFILYLHYCMVLSLQYYCMALQLQYYTILLYNLVFEKVT